MSANSAADHRPESNGPRLKLAPRTFHIFWDVHAWVGIAFALLLHVMFFAAAFALFYPELNDWAEPHVATQSVRTSSPPLQPLFEQLVREEHVLGRDRVAFMPRATALDAYWSQGEERRYFRFVDETGRLERTRSELGSFLYELHYLDPIPYGIYVAGVAAMALFLALVTGLLVHLKGIVREWFQFRPGRTARTWSSDLHKVLGVFGLPYQLLFAWSGAVLCLAGVTVEPTFNALVFRGNEAAAAAARGDSGESIEPTGKRHPRLPNIDQLVVRARTHVRGIEPEWIGIENVGDEGSHISVYGRVPGYAFGSADVTLRALDGAVLRSSSPRTATSLQQFEAWFFGLHYARFGGYGVKLLYALLAFATCAVILSGNLVWLERRDKKRAHIGNRILERLTVGMGAGVVLATGAIFLINRVLPVAIEHRSLIERAVFWSVLVLGMIVPFLWRSAKRVAGVQLVGAGALFTVAAVLDLLTRVSASTGHVHIGVDVGLMVLGLTCCTGGLRLARARRHTE